MNPTDFGDQMTSSLVPPGGQTFHSCSKISQHLHYLPPVYLLSQDSDPHIAPDGQASTLHCSLLPSVCVSVCVFEWVNERQIVKHFE